MRDGTWNVFRGFQKSSTISVNNCLVPRVEYLEEFLDSSSCEVENLERERRLF